MPYCLVHFAIQRLLNRWLVLLRSPCCKLSAINTMNTAICSFPLIIPLLTFMLQISHSVFLCKNPLWLFHFNTGIPYSQVNCFCFFLFMHHYQFSLSNFKIHLAMLKYCLTCPSRLPSTISGATFKIHYTVWLNTWQHNYVWLFPTLLPQCLKHTLVKSVYSFFSLELRSTNLFQPDNATDKFGVGLEFKNSSDLCRSLTSTLLSTFYKLTCCHIN